MHGINGVIAHRDKRVFADNEINFLDFLCAVRMFDGGEVEDEIDVVLVQIHTRLQRGREELLGGLGVDFVLFHELLYFVIAG